MSLSSFIICFRGPQPFGMTRDLSWWYTKNMSISNFTTVIRDCLDARQSTKLNKILFLVEEKG